MNLSGFSKISVVFFTILLFGFSFAFFPASLSQPLAETSFGPHWEQSCSEGRCTLTIYSYEKFFFNPSGGWEQINESFFPCGQRFCTRTYHFRAEATGGGEVSAFKDGQSLTLALESISGLPIAFTPAIRGSILSYRLRENLTLHYQYLPRRLKEELILHSPLPLPQQDITLTFRKSGNAAFILDSPTACDRKHNCTKLESWDDGSRIRIQLPASWLSSPRRAYPISIDPTIQLPDAFWNGYTTLCHTCIEGEEMSRTTNPLTANLVGREDDGGLAINTHRSGIDFNLSALPREAAMQSVNLTLTWLSLGDQSGVANIRHMEGNSSTYNNTNAGNTLFHADLANGTIYASGYGDVNIPTNYSLGLNGTQDLQKRIAAGSFSLGISDSSESCAAASCTAAQFGSSSNANTTRRPFLTVLYEPWANESEGRQAIEQGINSSLPNNPIQTGQQVYLLNQNNQQFLGLFDKSAQKDNQTWAFNYVTAGEQFTLMPSLFKILNIWENQSLLSAEIKTQVEAFINQTKV